MNDTGKWSSEGGPRTQFGGRASTARESKSS